jgi:hypothetical protein
VHDLDRGTASAPATLEVAPEDFHEGGILTTDASVRWAGSVAEDALSSIASPVLIGLESLAQRSDRYFENHPEERERAWFYEDEVYWRYFADEPAGRSVGEALCRPSGYALNAVSIVTQRPLGVETDLELDQLRFLAERVTLIVVEIFDGEGFAVWRAS